MDPVWVGVVGAAIGGVLGAATSLLSPLLNWRTERKRIELEHKKKQELLDKELEIHEAKIGIERQQRMEAEQHLSREANKDHLRKRISEWREGLRQSRIDWVAEDERSDKEAQQTGSADFKFSLAGETWFEMLRPHLQFDENDLYRVNFDLGDHYAGKISDEINRIEEEWDLV